MDFAVAQVATQKERQRLVRTMLFERSDKWNRNRIVMSSARPMLLRLNLEREAVSK